jgi:IrrE N-terminal-like domain
MRNYRGPEGDERIWYDESDIEQIMEDELRRGGLRPSADAPAVDIEAFIEDHLRASLDQHAALDATVLGLTEFEVGKAPAVRINGDLTGSAMDGDWTPPGVKGRWRATLAHEASHIVLHRSLYELNPDQTAMFADDSRTTGPVLLRCLKRDVAPCRARGDWREVQANRGMAALLMPKTLFVKAANRELGHFGDGGLDGMARRLAQQFEVSREAARIRLATLGYERATDSTALFGT